MTTHDLKTWPQPYAAVLGGEKFHEVRVNDRNYQSGDRVTLREYEPWPSSAPRGYTGHALTATIGYVSRGPEWGIPDGMCVFSLLDVKVLR